MCTNSCLWILETRRLVCQICGSCDRLVVHVLEWLGCKWVLRNDGGLSVGESRLFPCAMQDCEVTELALVAVIRRRQKKRVSHLLHSDALRDDRSASLSTLYGNVHMWATGALRGMFKTASEASTPDRVSAFPDVRKI